MHPEIKQMWVDALRSGDFKQGQGQLLENHYYCCLGVLCEITRQTIYPRDTELTSSMLKTCKISNKEQQKLICQNDGTGLYYDNSQSFSQIADWIEENL